MDKKKILAFEPWFFIFFGLFHLHRIWGLIDRNSYAEFWTGVLHNKGLFYFVLIGAVHGLLSFMKCSQEVVANLSGIFLWALIALLAVTFYTRKKLRSKWFALHRLLAGLLVASLVIHVVIVL